MEKGKFFIYLLYLITSNWKWLKWILLIIILFMFLKTFEIY
jgi:hypothetical protein